MHAPVGVVISVSDAVPVILIQLSLKISQIAGIAGDMLLCSLVDIGADVEKIKKMC